MAGNEERRRELLAAVALPAPERELLDAWLQGRGQLPRPQTLACFAHALNDSAESFARGEAVRAGHLPVFEALRGWMLTDPSPEQLAQLGHPLGVTPAALQLSLQRLRRRVRQRIDANLALWAPEAESRHTLRQSMRAALIGEGVHP